MFTPHFSHFLWVALHQWYRRRALPHGTVDVENRGIRMAYSNSYRSVTCLLMLGLVGPSCVVYFANSIFSGKSDLTIVAVKSAWTVLIAVILLAPIKAFREYLVVNDDGLLRSNLFGTQTKLDWREIKSACIDMKNSEVTFIGKGGIRLKTSLCYNGWHDFLEISAKHLNPSAQGQLLLAATNTRGKQKIITIRLA